MFGQSGKTFFLTLSVLSLVVPIGKLFWNPNVGVIALLIGLLIAARCIRLMRMIQTEGVVQDQHALAAKQNRAQTILVQLVDEAGNDLPPDVAHAKLARARFLAGPRDMVVGVRRKVP